MIFIQLCYLLIFKPKLCNKFSEYTTTSYFQLPTSLIDTTAIFGWRWQSLFLHLVRVLEICNILAFCLDSLWGAAGTSDKKFRVNNENKLHFHVRNCIFSMMRYNNYAAQCNYLAAARDMHKKAIRGNSQSHSIHRNLVNKDSATLIVC